MTAKRKPGTDAAAPTVENRRARHDYTIEDTLEVGLVLLGTEVKSLRAGQASLAQAYAADKDGALFLFNAHVAPWEQAGHGNHAPRRPRKLLLHRRQMDRLLQARSRRGMTLVPLRLYFNDRGRAKLMLGLARGKKLHDKRQAEKEKTWRRDKARLMRP